MPENPTADETSSPGGAHALFGDDSIGAGFNRTVARGGLLTAGSQAVSFGLNLLTYPILCHLLSPTDIGLVAISTVITGVASLFVDSGLSVAVVQSQRLTSQQASNLFWCNLLLGALAFVAAIGSAPFIATAYSDPRLEAIIVAASFMIPIGALGMQHGALLRRNLLVSQLAITTIASVVVGQALAVAIAWWTQSYWSLVVRIVAQSLVSTVLFWCFARWVPQRPAAGAGTRELATFGAKYFASQLINRIATYADVALLGIVSTPAAVGIYDRVVQLLIAPVRQMSIPLSGLMLPALSRTLSDPARYRSLFLAVLTLITAITTPLAGLVIAAPDWCVKLAMGEQWLEAIPYFRIAGVAMVLTPACNAANWLFTSQNRAGEMAIWVAVDAAWRLLVLAIASAWGLVGIVATLVIRLSTITPVYYSVLGRGGPVGLGSVVRLEAVGLFAVVSAVASVLGVRSLLPVGCGPAWGLLAAGAVSCLASAFVFLADPPSRARIVSSFRQLRAAVAKQESFA